jgi:hypothetical protein
MIASQQDRPLPGRADQRPSEERRSRFQHQQADEHDFARGDARFARSKRASTAGTPARRVATGA